MITINSFPQCGLGNRILYYNNLRQFAAKTDRQWSSVPWDGHTYFKGDMLNGSKQGKEFKHCLGENFFKWRTVPTRDIFSLQYNIGVPSNVCALHFRGTDFHQWNIDAVLDYNYYIQSLEELRGKASSFALFTDDMGLYSFQKTREYLEEHGLDFTVGHSCNELADLTYMSECDYIVSSPSTFCIVAGFIGNKKKIIHSEEWVTDRANRDDRFWSDLLGGGNDDYSIWRLI